jgi:hypothetical protein
VDFSTYQIFLPGPNVNATGWFRPPTTSRAWIREPADAGVDATASWATRQAPMMTAIRLRMPAPLQFVRMTISIFGSIVGPKARCGPASVHPIIAHGRVLGLETADAREANG